MLPNGMLNTQPPLPCNLRADQMARVIPEPLWPFVLRVYKADGVAGVCLELQETDGVDVPILLFSAWLGACARWTSLDDIAKLDAQIAPWRAEVVQPLRKIRQRLKYGPAPAPSDQTTPLREAIKSAELSAERLELAWLAEHADSFCQPSELGDAILQIDTAPIVAANLEAALQHFRKIPLDHASRQQLALIAAAV